MAKIYLVIFFSSFLYSTAIKGISSNEKKSKLKAKIIELQNKGQSSESLPYLKRYLLLAPYDISIQLIYAKSLLFRKDLPIPQTEEDIFFKNQKIKEAKGNYLEAAAVFSSILEPIGKRVEDNPESLHSDPLGKNLGKWYFLWALAEYYAENAEKSILLFKKAVKFDPTLVDSYYNISIIYRFLGKFTDAKIYLKKYGQEL